MDTSRVYFQYTRDYNLYYFVPSNPAAPWGNQDLWCQDNYNGGQHRVATGIPRHLIDALLKEGT